MSWYGVYKGRVGYAIPPPPPKPSNPPIPDRRINARVLARAWDPPPPQPVTARVPFPQGQYYVLVENGGHLLLEGGGRLILNVAPPPPPPPGPLVVTGVLATPGNNQNAVNWTIDSSFTSYNVLRSTTNGSGYAQLANVVTGPPTVTGFFLDNNNGGGLADGTTYYYVIQGVSSAGVTSQNSAQVAATPATNGTVPAPGSGSNVAGIITLQSSRTGTNINAMSFLPGATVYVRAAQQNTSTFAVTFETTGGGFTGCVAAWSGIGLTSSGVPTTDLLSFTVIDDQTISFVVPPDAQSGQLYVSNGTNAGFAPANLNITPTKVPAAPTGVTATVDPAGKASDLSWSLTLSSTGYVILRASASGGPFSQIATTTSLSYSDTGLTNGTTYYYEIEAVNSVGTGPASAVVSCTPVAPTPGNVTVTVNPAATLPISPYVYGINIEATIFSPGVPSIPYSHLTIDRLGGNRWTAANWQNGYSNAGSDYNYENDQYLTSSTTPLASMTAQFTTDRTNGLAAVMTFQLQGYVSGDDSGPVSVTNPIQANRFKTVAYTKASVSSAPFTTTPSNSNSFVAMDELAYAMDAYYSGQNVFGNNPTTYPIQGQLDNEPDAWSSTHAEVQPVEPSAATFIANSLSLATALKAQYPNMVIYGAVNASFASMFWWRGYQDYPNAQWGAGNYTWFVDGYISAVKGASPSPTNLLVNVFDYHWYSQVPDPVTGGGIGGGNSSTTLSTAQITAIVQGPRSFYDPTFVENSYITQDVTGNTGINILPVINAKIANSGTNMKHAISEWFMGGNQHIAGTIAHADSLGAFGNNNIYASMMWPNGGTGPYAVAAFTAFRNFDGAGSHFGETSVSCSSSNLPNVSVWVSTSTTHSGRVVMVVINRSPAPQNVTVTGQALTGTARLWQITASSAAANVSANAQIVPVLAGTQAASGSSITFSSLPAYSVTTVDIY